MARYKDIDAIIERMNGSTAETWGKGLGRSWWSHSVMLKDNIVQLMKDAPEADVVEVRHGHWEDRPNPQWKAYDIRHCSKCGWNIPKNNLRKKDLNWNYCPECGAKMDGRRKDDE